jgi:predicted Rossmann-fold nucleotide-binding protein
MTIKTRLIAVIGGSQCSSQEARLAEEVGCELAKRGATLVCGGLGGVMEAACKGASSEDGVTIGILPGSSRPEAVIAIGGGYGTLSEIGHALRNGVPVVGLNTWLLSRNGQADNSIIPAQNPTEAVDIALSLATNQ